MKLFDSITPWIAAFVFATLAMDALGTSTADAEDLPGQAVGRSDPMVSAGATAESAHQQASDEVKSTAVRPSLTSAASAEAASPPMSNEPEWVADAILYQIFTERFCNGDPANDPTRQSLEDPDQVPSSWKISRWTSDWYQAADWEQEMDGGARRGALFQRRYGGDLQGIINRLQYLRDLGVNTIYLNPVFYASSLHKYDGNSFHHVDPYFGPDPDGDLALMAGETSDPSSWHWTAADKLFLRLVSRAHAMGIRVVLDGVFNHTGRRFFAFEDVRRHQASSRYKDWYVIESFDDPATDRNDFRYRGWAGHRSLPEFADVASGDDLQPGPKQYVFDITNRWMDPDADGDPSDGIDGWRLDVAPDVPVKFWKEWNELVRRINPDAYTVAEIWDEASSLLKEGKFSSTMNYFGFAFPIKGFVIDGALTQSEAIRQLNGRRNSYPASTQFALLNLIDSHDTDRVASMIVNAGRRSYARPERFDYDMNSSPSATSKYDVRKPNQSERRIQRLVALLQMTYVGPPLIYYGTEAGMWGADDPNDRMPMVWPEMTYDPQKYAANGTAARPDTVEFDTSLFNYYRAAAALRTEHSALRRGAIEFIENDPAARFLAFRRKDESETLLVGINRSDVAYRWRLPLAFGESASQIFTASGNIGDFSIEQDADGMSVLIPPCDGVVLSVNRFE